MKIFASGRRTGKTTELIKLAADRNGYIVVPHYDMIKYVEKLANEMGVQIHRPIDFSRLLADGGVAVRGLQGPFFFDNADMMLRSLVHGEAVDAISVEGNALNLRPSTPSPTA